MSFIRSVGKVSFVEKGENQNRLGKKSKLEDITFCFSKKKIFSSSRKNFHAQIIKSF
jgi:hypothetical protein